MAATEEKKYLINVEDNLDEYAKNAASAKKEVEALKKENEALKKSGTATSDQIEKSNAALKAAQKNYNASAANLQKLTSAQSANGTSYVDLYKQWQAGEARLKSLQGTIIQNADGTYKLSDAYVKEKKVVDEAKKALDKFGEGIHNNTLNVGNYTEGMKSALKQTGLFSGAFNVIGDVKGKFEGGVTGVKKFASSFSTVKAAIASTGIGILIIAIGALFSWFTKSAEGSKILKQAMAAVGEVFNTLVGTLVKVGGLLKDLFTGDWGKLKNDIKGIGDEWRNIGKNMKEAADIAKLELELAKEKRKNIVDEAELTRDIAKLRLDAADKTKSNKERVDALRKSLELEKSLTKEKIDLADQELEIVRRKIALQESHGVKASKEDKDRLAELTAAKINAESEEFQRSKRAVSQLSALQKEMQQTIYNDKKARLEAEGILAEGNYEKMKKNLIDEYKLEITQADLTKNQKYLLRVQLDKALKDLDKKRADESKELDKSTAEFSRELDKDAIESTKNFYDKAEEERANNARARIETRKLESNGDLKILQDILDEEFSMFRQSEEYKKLSNDQKLLADAQYLAQTNDISNQARQQELQYMAASNEEKRLLDEQYAAQQKGIALDVVQYEQAMDKIKLQQKRETFAATADLLGAMSSLIGDNTKAGKSFAIAQATINTYLAASQALANAPNPIIGAIQAAAAIALGLKQVKEIVAVKVNKNATGGGGSASGGGSTVSASFTAANSSIAQSATQGASANRLGEIQQNITNQATTTAAAQTTAQAINEKPIVVSVEAFEAKAAEKRQIEVRSNI